MNALHQYLFDTYRAGRLGEPMPPAPGTQDVAVFRALRDRRRLERATAGRGAGDGPLRRLRTALRGRRT
ncbi:hypothetical protein ACF07V_37095 [Streptomyces sp. NPDC015661]|uniref:hypothetical protein n=1 Tax=Streptomyces sp. NPDC015661 TaxID=3364961 RepID=UPI0036FB10A7